MQQHHPSSKRAAGVPALAFVFLLVTAANARAEYTVIDDDLYPVAMVEARNNPALQAQAEKFRVGFTKGSSVLGPIAKASVEGILPKLGGGVQITLVARIDTPAGADSAKQQGLALARGNAIRAYLISQGVFAEQIRVEVDPAGNPQSASGVSVADIIVSRPAAPAAPMRTSDASAPRAIPHEYRNLRAAEQVRPQPTPEPATRGSNNERLIQYINNAVQTGQMAPAVAAQILRSMLDAGEAQSQPAPQYAPAAPQYLAPVAAPAVAQPAYRYAPATAWELDARYSLKENVEAWARASGWRPVMWEATNHFEVTSNRTLEGGFPDVLRRVADSTGLNICANPRERTIRVTDPGISCSK